MDGTSRIPFAAYTREDLYQRELERFFYRGHWCYVGLEAECPIPATSSAPPSASAR
jgi:salicylate 5-hydroxylase large subunit